MPAFKLTFRKEFDLVVQAESKKEVDEAAMEMMLCGALDYEWNTGEWDFECGFPISEKPDHGVVDGEIVNIMDYAPKGKAALKKGE